MNKNFVLKSEESDRFKLELHKSSQNIDELKKQLATKESIIEQQNNDLERYRSELREVKGHEIEVSDTSSSLRLKCIKCGAVGKDIKTVEDKNKPISYIGNIPMYAKINVCKKCGNEF
jgi:chromosome segregation ATPase